MTWKVPYYPQPLPSNRIETLVLQSNPTEDGKIVFEKALSNVYLACKGIWRNIAGSNHRSGHLFFKNEPALPRTDGCLWYRSKLQVSIGNQWYPFAARSFTQTYRHLGSIVQMNLRGEWIPISLPYPLDIVHGISNRLIPLNGGIVTQEQIQGRESWSKLDPSGGEYLTKFSLDLPLWDASTGSYQGTIAESQVDSKMAWMPLQRDSEFLSEISMVGFHVPRFRVFPRCPKAYIASAGTTNTVIDLRVNGVTILATPISIPSGQFVSTSGQLNVSSVSENDRVEIYIIQAGNGAKGVKIDWPL